MVRAEGSYRVECGVRVADVVVLVREGSNADTSRKLLRLLSCTSGLALSESSNAIQEIVDENLQSNLILRLITIPRSLFLLSCIFFDWVVRSTSNLYLSHAASFMPAYLYHAMCKMTA